jgi:hypothetical protein
MGIDLDLIRRKIDELNGIKKQTTSMTNMWKPEVGEYRVRVLPWGDNQPIKERYFYYLENAPSVLAPYQFGKTDPINDLMKALYKSGSPEEKNVAKKLMPKMRAYVPVIVRGEESKGVMLWAFGKLVYQRILGFFVDAEVGDISDPESGFDLIVKISKLPGKQFNDTTVDAARKPSKLSSDVKQVQAWIKSVPNIDEVFKLKTTEEIKEILNNWLNGIEDESPSTEQPAAAQQSPKEKTTAPQTFSDLDSAFADLLEEQVKF